MSFKYLSPNAYTYIDGSSKRQKRENAKTLKTMQWAHEEIQLSIYFRHDGCKKVCYPFSLVISCFDGRLQKSWLQVHLWDG